MGGGGVSFQYAGLCKSEEGMHLFTTMKMVRMEIQTCHPIYLQTCHPVYPTMEMAARWLNNQGTSSSNQWSGARKINTSTIHNNNTRKSTMENKGRLIQDTLSSRNIIIHSEMNRMANNNLHLELMEQIMVGAHHHSHLVMVRGNTPLYQKILQYSKKLIQKTWI
jgi:hypothetical protein